MNNQSEFPIISIVTPSFNHGKFISNTIEKFKKYDISHAVNGCADVDH
jgi:hypothetical protein